MRKKMEIYSTPKKVVQLLQKAVTEKSQYAVAKETGLSLSVIQGLLKGNREPATSTFFKLSKYFNVSVADLRSEGISLVEQELRALSKEIVKLNDFRENITITDDLHPLKDLNQCAMMEAIADAIDIEFIKQGLKLHVSRHNNKSRDLKGSFNITTSSIRSMYYISKK